MTRLRMGKSVHRWEVVNPTDVRLRISTPFCLVLGRFALNPVRPLSRFTPIPVRPGSFRPYSCSPRVVSPSFINSALKNEMENTIANIRILDVVRLVHDMGTLFLSSS